MDGTKADRLKHAKYEYDMATFCVRGLGVQQEQAIWNVLLAAFGVYFRNSRDFLRNHGDQESIKAKTYVSRFNASSAEHLEKKINELHQQVLHLSGKRVDEPKRKVGHKTASELMEWLDPNMNKFLAELSKEYKAVWDETGPQGPSDVPNLTWGPTSPSSPPACNHIYIVRTDPPTA